MTAIAEQLDAKLNSLDAKAASSLEKLIRDALEMVESSNGISRSDRLPLDFFSRIAREFGSEPFVLTLVSGGFLFSGSASMRPGLWRCRRPRAVRRAGGGRGRCGYAARLARPAIADGIRRLPGKTTPGALRPPARLSRGSPRSGIFSNSIINAVMLVSNSDVSSHVAHRSRFLIRGSPFQYTPLLQDCFGLKGPTWQSSCSMNRRICSSGSQVS